MQGLLSGATLLTDREATESQLLALAPGRRVLHLATHGFADKAPPRRPSFSVAGASQDWAAMQSYFRDRTGVVLTDGRVLNPPRVLQLDLRGTELVVLSACQTALGPKQSDEGVIGLRRAFRFAGTRWLVVSLWKVDDRATRALMERFYAHYLKGITPDLALRQAQLDLLRGEQYPGPYYWAAFIPVGFSALSSAAP